MASFRYTQLDRSTRSIRLLSFVDDPPGPGIHCALETFNLDRCPPFVALSYTWGDPKPCRRITVNHQPLGVRENLFSALEMLSIEGVRFSEDPSREMTLIGQYFWIDYLCINQEDLHERGQQVNLMADIFSGATSVVAWLGPAADDSAYAMEAISEGMMTHRTWDLMRLGHAFYQLLRRPYWRRMWILQEFILPENILFLCGRRGAWYSRLHASLDVIRDLVFPYRAGDRQAADLDLTILCDAREQWTRPGGRSSGSFALNSLVSQFFRAPCSDTRDRVYALLSLTTTTTTTNGMASSSSGGGGRSDKGDGWLPRPGTTTPPPPPPLLADYTMTEERLYYRVLGHMRHAPSLAPSNQWRRFRFTLSSALHIARHRSSFLIREALYNLSEVRRVALVARDRDRARASRAPPAASAQQQAPPPMDGPQTAYFLHSLADHLQWPVGSFQSQHGDGGDGGAQEANNALLLLSDRANKAAEILEHFRFFPRDDDPEAWSDFTDLVQEALSKADYVLAGVPFVPWSAGHGRWGFEEEREQERRELKMRGFAPR